MIYSFDFSPKLYSINSLHSERYSVKNHRLNHKSSHQWMLAILRKIPTDFSFCLPLARHFSFSLHSTSPSPDGSFSGGNRIMLIFIPNDLNIASFISMACMTAFNRAQEKTTPISAVMIADLLPTLSAARAPCAIL